MLLGAAVDWRGCWGWLLVGCLLGRNPKKEGFRECDISIDGVPGWGGPSGLLPN